MINTYTCGLAHPVVAAPPLTPPSSVNHGNTLAPSTVLPLQPTANVPLTRASWCFTTAYVLPSNTIDSSNGMALTRYSISPLRRPQPPPVAPPPAPPGVLPPWALPPRSHPPPSRLLLRGRPPPPHQTLPITPRSPIYMSGLGHQPGRKRKES